MCGICGILTCDKPPDRGAVEGMLRAIKHRGPDDDGIWTDAVAGLGHARLSILDLSPKGHQPMLESNGSRVIVYNGEVYNFADIQRDLGGEAEFSSRTDTEVILRAYRSLGVGCLERFRGMFAFAIWDSKDQTLLLARDRLGKKPLYYYADGKRLAFASEIKSLLTLPWVPRRMDRSAVMQYLALQYIPGPQTIFENIYKLPPASYAIVRKTGNGFHMDVQRYWAPPQAAGDARSKPAPDLVDRLDELLIESVRLRLVSDVEVGVLLSGGLDSSLMTSMATRAAGEPLRSFSVKFADARFDESAYAQAMAKQLGTRHHELTADEITTELFHRILRQLDEPMADPAAIPTYLIAQCAAQYVKVILSGEGADELFGGYPHYLTEQRWAPLLALPHSARAAFRRALTTLTGFHEWGRRPRRLAKVLSSPVNEGAIRWVRVFGDADLRRYLAPGWLDLAGALDPLQRTKALYDASQASTSIEKSMDVDLRVWLPDDLLMKVDKMTMAHGLEARAPFLDHKLVEFVSPLPAQFKMHNGITKALLKQVAKRYLPDDIIFRRKHGFEVPVATWMLHNFRDAAEATFSEQALQQSGIFNPSVLHAEWEMLKQGSRRAYPRRLWLAFCILQWQSLYGVQPPSS